MQRVERDFAELQTSLLGLEKREPRSIGFFDGASEAVLTRAPGRLDVMGGIADYSGSLVLELPLAEATCVAAARTDDDQVRVVSLRRDGQAEAPREACFDSRELWAACASLATLRRYFLQQRPASRFAAYALGGLPLLGARGAHFVGGLRIVIDSQVPEGQGLSSSAALEVAALAGLAELWGVPLGGRELALACQQVENVVVGAPCGVMDQLTCACGEPDKLLSILCQPAELRGSVALPEGVSVFGIDSGVQHAVGGTQYRHVRVAAFMGLRILAEKLGARVRSLEPGRVVLEADPLRGYLANLAPNELDQSLLEALPQRISGQEFVARFSGISDDATTIEPAVKYMVRAATLHPIFERSRAERFAAALSGATRDAELSELGAEMFASHASYSACGLGSDGTDQLVEAARALGSVSGIFGAKISGGGSGGAICVLARTEQLAQLRALSRDYAEKTGRRSSVFAGSSPGAVAVPARRFALRS